MSPGEEVEKCKQEDEKEQKQIVQKAVNDVQKFVNDETEEDAHSSEGQKDVQSIKKVVENGVKKESESPVHDRSDVKASEKAESNVSGEEVGEGGQLTPDTIEEKVHGSNPNAADATVSEAESDTNTISGGGEILLEGKDEAENSKPIISDQFDAKLNRSAVKYNRLPISAEFARGLDLKQGEKNWIVKCHQNWDWPISFHQEGGLEMIRGWRAVVQNLNVDVGTVVALFKTADTNIIQLRICDKGLEPDSTGTQHGDITLGDVVVEEQNSPGEGSVIRYIDFNGNKLLAFMKRLAIGAVRPYGSNPPRLELHHKAAEVLNFLAPDKVHCGTLHSTCIAVNGKGQANEIKVTIRSYVVLRWAQPSFKRFYKLNEGDTIVFRRSTEPCIIKASIERNTGEAQPQKKRAPRGEGTRKRGRKEGNPGNKGGRNANRSEVKDLAVAVVGSKKRKKAHQVELSRKIKLQQITDEAQLELLGGSLDAFLEKHGLEKFIDNFKKEEITLKTLSTGLITEEHLKSIGMPIGPRLELLYTVERLTF